MPERIHQFTIRGALIVAFLLAASFALIRAAFSNWGPESHVDDSFRRIAALLAGVHLLVGTTGSSISLRAAIATVWTI